jgi:hypothetical protein
MRGTGRQAADAVRGRLDWKYALGLELEDPDFDRSVLSEFRVQLARERAEQLLLDKMLMHRGWLAQGQGPRPYRLNARAGVGQAITQARDGRRNGESCAERAYRCGSRVVREAYQARVGRALRPPGRGLPSTQRQSSS